MNKGLFTNDGFFFIAVILSVLGTIPFAICGFSLWPEYSYMPIIGIVNAVCIIALYVSYKKHAKNVMKGLIGSLLMGLLAITITATFPLDLESKLYTVVSLINCFAVLLLCFNHYVINSDHHSMSSNVLVNQMLLFMMFILYVAMALIWVNGMSGTIVTLYMAGIPVSVFGTTAAIVCVESRLDAYRIDRENAGWSEEKGYPEGYVHQKDK